MVHDVYFKNSFALSGYKDSFALSTYTHSYGTHQYDMDWSSSPASMPMLYADIARLPLRMQQDKLLLHRAIQNQTKPEVVVALILANPAAASQADAVRCGSDMLRCVCMCAVCKRVSLWDIFLIVHVCEHGKSKHTYRYMKKYVYIDMCIKKRIQICLHTYVCILILSI